MEPQSRTQKKNEARGLQLLGERLVKLSRQQLENMEIPNEVMQAVIFAKTIKKHGAYRRQMQHIGALMREIDSEPIQKAREVIALGNYRKAIEFKEIEKLRDELIDGNGTLIEEIMIRFPEAERQRLTQLVRNAGKERENHKPPQSSKMLFRYLRQVFEAAEGRSDTTG
ncbi:MAG: ribosome biogenesis factor YjgA [Desulfobacterales bacterium]